MRFVNGRGDHLTIQGKAQPDRTAVCQPESARMRQRPVLSGQEPEPQPTPGSGSASVRPFGPRGAKAGEIVSRMVA